MELINDAFFKYDEALAILVGDALIADAFEVVSTSSQNVQLQILFVPRIV